MAIILAFAIGGIVLNGAAVITGKRRWVPAAGLSLVAAAAFAFTNAAKGHQVTLMVVFAVLAVVIVAATAWKYALIRPRRTVPQPGTGIGIGDRRELHTTAANGTPPAS